MWYHRERLSVSETDSGVGVLREVVSVVFQNHCHWGVLKSRLIILDHLMSDAFQGLSEFFEVKANSRSPTLITLRHVKHLPTWLTSFWPPFRP